MIMERIAFADGMSPVALKISQERHENMVEDT